MGKLGQIFVEQYQVEMPLIRWNNIKLARLSVQIYTSQDELDVFVEALSIHLPACQTA